MEGWLKRNPLSKSVLFTELLLMFLKKIEEKKMFGGVVRSVR